MRIKIRSIWYDSEEEPNYHVRERFNQNPMEYRKPAMFVFLNKFGFNGLCRYNQKGKFNVPYGDARTPVIPEKEIRQFSEKLGSLGFLSADFRDIPIKSGDVVYCDPPFTSLDVNGFTSYASGGFGLDEHKNWLKWLKNLVCLSLYIITILNLLGNCTKTQK